MKIRKIFDGLLVLMILVAFSALLLTGCNEEKAKDFGKLAVLAGEYQLATDADKPEKLDKLKESAVAYTKTYGKADAESLVVKLRDNGKIGNDIASWLLTKIKAAPDNTAVP